jgi:hypothetical protein
VTALPVLNRAHAHVDAGEVRSIGRPGLRSTTRRAIVAAIALALVVALASPEALAAGEGTIPPGVTDDPFTGSPSAPATAGSTGFRFFGSGFGHGIGMSQWGAYGLAQMGWAHKRILKQFYRSTRVERLADPVRSIRVGLAWDHTLMHVEAKSGPVHLWVGREGGRKVGRIPAGRTWTVRARSSGFAVTDHDGKLVGGHTWGGTGFDLIATYGAGARAFVREAGYSYNRGSLEFNLYKRGGSWNERLVLPIPFEQYLYGLGEMPSSWPASALRAQAVAGRTFATYKV